MLMDGDHLGRIAYETIRQLGDMDKPVFLDPYIDETTEVGDVGHDTGNTCPSFKSSIVFTVGRTQILGSFGGDHGPVYLVPP